MAPQQQSPSVVVEIPGVGNVEFPASMSTTQIAQAAAKLHHEAVLKDPNRKPASAEQFMTQPEPDAIDALLGFLPAAGGTVGGIVGGIGGTVAGMGIGGVPGAVGGAALGGAAGESLRQLINFARGADVPDTAGARAMNIAKQGGIQGATEVVGGGLAKGAQVAGKALMENAVRPTDTLLRDFPTVIETLLRERLPVGRFLPGMAKGSEQAGAKLGAAAGSVRELLTRAENAGTRFSADQVLAPVTELIDDIAKQPLAKADQQRLASMIDQFLAEHPGPLTPNAVKDLKQAAQRLSQNVMKAERMGAPLTSEQSIGAQFNRSVAKGARQTLETIPGVGQGEKLAQDLIGAKRALSKAEQRRLSLMAESVSGLAGAVAGVLGPAGSADDRTKDAALAWLVTRGLASPRSMSRGGLALTSQAAQQLVRQFPRLAAYVVMGAGSEQPAQ